MTRLSTASLPHSLFTFQLVHYPETSPSGQLPQSPNFKTIHSLRHKHSPGLVCHDNPPMNIFLEKKETFPSACDTRPKNAEGAGQWHLLGVTTHPPTTELAPPKRKSTYTRTRANQNRKTPHPPPPRKQPPKIVEKPTASTCEGMKMTCIPRVTSAVTWWRGFGHRFSDLTCRDFATPRPTRQHARAAPPGLSPPRHPNSPNSRPRDAPRGQSPPETPKQANRSRHVTQETGTPTPPLQGRIETRNNA